MKCEQEEADQELAVHLVKAGGGGSHRRDEVRLDCRNACDCASTQLSLAAGLSLREQYCTVHTRALHDVELFITSTHKRK